MRAARWTPLLLFVLIIPLGVLVHNARGVPMPLNEERLAESAEVVFSGAVRRIYESNEGARARYLAEIVVEEVHQGVAVEVGQAPLVAYQGQRIMPMTTGGSGHSPKPEVGMRVKVFARGRDGLLEALFPNGFTPADPLVFAQVHDEEAYERLVEECWKTARYQLGVDFAERRLRMGWNPKVAQRHARMQLRVGDPSRATLPALERLAAEPQDLDAMRLLAGVAWDAIDDEDFVADLADRARTRRHAGVLGMLAGHLAWRNDGDAGMDLFTEAVGIDPSLSGGPWAESVYFIIVGNAIKIGDLESAREWTEQAIDMFGDDNGNWQRRLDRIDRG